jgi:glyceraldehyde-3-phosphate dehydrogenase (NADP+)
MYINSRWVDAPERIPVVAPFSSRIIEEVPQATPSQIEETLAAAEKAARVMASLTAYERHRILCRAADLIAAHSEELSRTISLEVGKPIREARIEVGRMPDLLRLCAFEGSQLRGETLPLDAQAGVKDKLGMTWRVPCGVVLAITPFNYPLLLVLHKVGPALASGNAVILKPAEQTPLVALKVTMLMIEAGLPENALQCVTGAGEKIGPLLCIDRRVRKISFTGSAEVGEAITRTAGIKKVSLELGSNSPLILLPDADLEQVASVCALGGYVNSGQVCASVQRILVDQRIYGDFLDALKPRVETIRMGDPLEETTGQGTMISEEEARRVEAWIREALENGARLVTGGQRSGAAFAPTIVADVDPNLRLSKDELFGPAVAVTPVESLEEALTLANTSEYGLSSGIFTRDIGQALGFARRVETGNVMINWSPLWRADLMPFGGLKRSGFGKEGVRYAVEDMTEIKTVVIHGLDN